MFCELNEVQKLESVAMAKDDPRNHHYIPQAYLRGFGWKRGEKQWYVHAYAMKELRHFQPNIKGVCAQRDFMRVDVPGHDPYKLEEEMSKFESRARESILRVAETRMFDGEDRTYILNLMALFAVRYPQMREHMREFQERVLKQVLGLTLAEKGRWESQIRQMKEAGVAVNDKITYEQAKDFHERGEYTIEVPRERHIETETKLHETVLQLLGNRKWTVLYAGEDQGKFLTSDHPVVITWDEPQKMPPFMRHSPGFGMRDTEVVFPLTSTTFLVGRFDGDEGVHEASGGLIGYYNTLMIGHCFDFAFSQEPAFPYLIPPDDLYFDDRYLERVKAFYEKQKSKHDGGR
jgi:hypothetical protein